MNPTFYKITVCQIITLFGNAALRFALPLYLLRRTDSAALYGSVTALALVPMLLGTLAGGVLADRCRKQKIMAVLDTVSAIGMAAAAAAMLGVPVTPLVLAALCLLYAVEGLYQPAVQASLPLLLDGAALARGNAVIQLVDTIDELLGPLLGSVLLHTLELRGLLLLCAVCFAVSALWERTLPIPHAPAARSDQRLPPKALFLQARPLLRLAMVLALLNLAVVPAFTVGVPLLIVRYYAFSDTALAVTQSAMSAGGLLGGVLAGAFCKAVVPAPRHSGALVHYGSVRTARVGRSAVCACRSRVHRRHITGFLHDGYRRTVSDPAVYCNSGPCTHRADRPLYEPYHGLCLPDPAGRAGGVRAFVRSLCCPAQCRAFCGGGCLDFYKPCCIAHFQKSRFFYKIMNASLPIY